MGYRYVVIPQEVVCEDGCDLPDPYDLHYTQAGTIYQCDRCAKLYSFKIGRRGSHFWRFTTPEEQKDKL